MKRLTRSACQETDERVLTADFSQVFSAHASLNFVKRSVVPSGSGKQKEQLPCKCGSYFHHLNSFIANHFLLKACSIKWENIKILSVQASIIKLLVSRCFDLLANYFSSNLEGSFDG